ETFELSQNYPNPFNPTTRISFTIPATAMVQLKVYNVLGQEVATLVNETMTNGSHTVTFDASKLASGVYLYKITAGNFVSTKKMVLLK
ncbi:MAG TPA: T9SS type A sorting domain-containing protein, partial [Bacteroidota bacterium]|nr:T9SS type A sorting domain-containing protein [Bacteroidota bacterium]